MKKIIFIVSILFSSLFASNQEVTVTILPQKYFVEKIVKDKFSVNVMVPPGSSPHNFEPKPSAMKALFNSKAYFLIGEPSEKAWIKKFKQNAKNTTFVDTTVGVEKIEMVAHEHHEEKEDKHKGHKHEHEEDKHDHSGVDPHIWLDPILVKIQAKNIYEAMIKIDAQNSDFYKTNYEEFIKELDSLDSEIKNILAPYKDKAFMVFHPSWGYFAARYEIEQISIEVEGKEPKPNELVKLVEEAKKHDIKIIFVSPQFSQNSAKTISNNIGGNVVAINPLTDDWHNNLLTVAKEIANSYK
ncbi:metal ABC transporter solute-binding protein, Zn/Mn family [Aliarcobacter cibarius]|jgi:zinc transport system substrate-binding protein|uniref:Cation ABC transporter substrate-binding protein n=1 Tax=Aliarcobacter cibarius TaxID=255507 RepID=A0A5J6RMJ9_9BACT|nr:zinc ABC transporter substrate-binding protein [Aliarcobacter cibarius]QEZ89681.1 metal ion ABC transporter, periplasmic metal-binding protein [Aliarcobacter cibarius]QKJ27690.1 metal ion ABC transporter, periplasmic metal-binding protein [Aliarcobacter cibarius]TLS96837.1 cation ABC transporter substrate-binding protein [Aliarcobacter cibarius]TLS97342.1 cation ABC transporter substrate-binding protein [Aliarcobacter cibarius]TLT03382.1 cation ABC transporter substrate-binding protein [Ali